MFDAGECAQIAYGRAKLGWNKSMKIIITHLHGDHCIGILGMLQTMSMRRRTEPLEILGPRGIEEFVSANIKMLNFTPPFPLSISVVEPGRIAARNGAYEILACKASHSITAFSYILQEHNKPGKFSRERAESLGVPMGRLWGDLQGGSEVVTPHGATVRPEQVMGSERQGTIIGISGDTMPSAELEEFFKECDYLVFDATFLDAERQKAAETRHSTASQAASLAKSARVKNLILTHFSTRYNDTVGHLEEAGQIHPSVTAAEDMMEIKIV